MEPIQCPELCALQEHQAKIDAAQKDLEMTRAAIAEQEYKISEIAVAAASDNHESLEMKHQIALADLSVGKGSTADIELLECQIRESETDINNKCSASSRLQNTISGLKIREEEHIASLGALRKESQFLLRKYLFAAADILGAEFLEKSKPLIAIFERIEGIGSLLAMLGHVPHIRAQGFSFNLPGYNLPSFAGKGLRFKEGMTYTIPGWAEVNAAAQKEKSAILDSGIEFPDVQ